MLICGHWSRLMLRPTEQQYIQLGHKLAALLQVKAVLVCAVRSQALLLVF